MRIEGALTEPTVLSAERIEGNDREGCAVNPVNDDAFAPGSLAIEIKVNDAAAVRWTPRGTGDIAIFLVFGVLARDPDDFAVFEITDGGCKNFQGNKAL